MKKYKPTYGQTGIVAFFIFFLIGILTSCGTVKEKSHQKITADTALLDSVKKASDSAYSKPYYTRDFAMAEYLVNKKDSTTAQIMKDKDSVIQQVIITKNKNRIYFAQYYSNGQLMAKYSLDKFGQYDGYSEEYYESGIIKSSGMYRGGLHTGPWKNFDIRGKLVSTDTYNENGQLSSTGSK